MNFIGTVTESGMVALPANAKLPVGTRVRVVTEDDDATSPSLAETFKEFIGACDNLPSDLAQNHDHYAHGAMRK
jgi:hypothetical protein